MENAKFKKILVTGGAGFIGSHVVDLLIKNGYQVAVVDDLSAGNRKNLNPKAKFFKINILSPKLIDIFSKFKPQAVIHHAAQINVRSSITEPIFDAKTNILGSINLLEACRRIKIKKIVYANSGGAMYGEPKKLPCSENHPIQPLSPYGISKQTIEHYLWFYHKLSGIDYNSLRYANVYGPRQDPKGEAGVVAIFIDKLLAGERPVIFSDGEQTRDFVFVADVAEANLAALQKMTKSHCFNIGSGQAFSVNQIFKSLSQIIQTQIKPKFGPAVPGEVRDIVLDTNLAKKELGWQVKTRLYDGLKKTVAWFKF